MLQGQGAVPTHVAVSICAKAKQIVANRCETPHPNIFCKREKVRTFVISHFHNFTCTTASHGSWAGSGNALDTAGCPSTLGHNCPTQHSPLRASAAAELAAHAGGHAGHTPRLAHDAQASHAPPGIPCHHVLTYAKLRLATRVRLLGLFQHLLINDNRSLQPKRNMRKDSSRRTAEAVFASVASLLPFLS